VKTYLEPLLRKNRIALVRLTGRTRMSNNSMVEKDRARGSHVMVKLKLKYMVTPKWSNSLYEVACRNISSCVVLWGGDFDKGSLH
jgi:hypothetical protein